MKFHSVRVRMDEVSLEKSKISLFSSETIITLFIHSLTIREYGCPLKYTIENLHKLGKAGSIRCFVGRNAMKRWGEDEV